MKNDKGAEVQKIDNHAMKFVFEFEHRTDSTYVEIQRS